MASIRPTKTAPPFFFPGWLVFQEATTSEAFILRGSTNGAAMVNEDLR
jgi:hypothetical protein